MNSTSNFVAYSHPIRSIIPPPKGWNYQLSQNSSGKWLIKMYYPPHNNTKIWILQQVTAQKWLLSIDDIPQFFLSPENVLHLLNLLQQELCFE